MTIEEQASQVDKVKRSEHGVITDPFFLAPENSVREAVALMERYKISGVPITKNGKLVGILTNRDLRFESNYDQPIDNVMTKKNLVTAPVGTSLEEAQKILGKHRIEKLPIVDKDGYLMMPRACPTMATCAACCMRSSLVVERMRLHLAMSFMRLSNA